MSPNSPLNIAIIGCGTAGSASALFLNRLGHAVTLYERVEDPGPVGAGIVLQPTGLFVLEELGLLDEILPYGARIDRLYCENLQRKSVVDLSYADVDSRYFGLGIHRGVIFKSLYQALLKAGICLHCGTEILHLFPRGVRYELEDAHQNRYGPYDLVIVADGARSQLRTASRIRKQVREYPWGALWFVGEDLDHQFHTILYQVVCGTQKMLGLLPTGFKPDASPPTPVVSLFWSLRKNQFELWQKEGLASWKKEVLEFSPRAAPILDQINDSAQLTFATYQDVSMYPWHAGRILYLGDAGHAMSPQLGQGTNLALWDAMTLAQSLHENREIDAALGQYSKRRRRHLKYYEFVTRALTPFFQSDYSLLSSARDFGMPLLCKIPFFRNQMIRGMIGIQRGFVRKPICLG